MTMTDPRSRWLALIVVCIGDLMIVLDATIVNVALPSIQADLGFSETSLAWVVERLPADLRRLHAARRPARRPVRPAPGVPDRPDAVHASPRSPAASRTRRTSLIAARAVQGLGGAIVAAIALALLMKLFTEPGERAKAMGVFGFVVSGGGTLGVLLGGVLTDAFDWHWIFLVNLPIGIAVFALCLRAAPDRPAADGSGRWTSPARSRSPRR